MIFIKTDGIPPAAKKVDNLGLGIGEYARGEKKKKKRNQGTCTCKTPPLCTLSPAQREKKRKKEEKRGKKKKRTPGIAICKELNDFALPMKKASYGQTLFMQSRTYTLVGSKLQEHLSKRINQFPQNSLRPLLDADLSKTDHRTTKNEKEGGSAFIFCELRSYDGRDMPLDLIPRGCNIDS